MVRLIILYIGVVLSLFPSDLTASGGKQHRRDVSTDVENKYTSVGNIGLTVTNFGTIGTRNLFWPNQPSCEYPRGSRIEHVYEGSLWVGAVLIAHDSTDGRNGQIFVTTGSSDRSSTASGNSSGYEFNAEPEDSITELSTLADNRPATSEYSPLAVSHQDFVCNYSDRYTRVPATGDSIQNHTPLGIRVHQESYAWNYPFSDFFVILQYDIYNASLDTLDSVYVGLWDNAVVRNTNYVQPRTPGYFDRTGQGYDPQQRMAYSFDFDGAPGGPPANSYIGARLLGATPFPVGVDSIGNLTNNTYYNAWQFRASTVQDEYLSPTDDYNASNRYLSRYSRMTQSMPQSAIDPLRIAPRNVTYLLSTGPWHRLNPGDSIEVVFGIVCGKKYGNDAASLDTRLQRSILYANASWAQRTYQGEDLNGNNILDPGEDVARRDSVSPTEFGLRYEPDGKITRYLLPAPPHTPKSRVEVDNRSVVLYWDKTTAEESVDPVTGIKDFEGYRVYRTNAGTDFKDPEDFLLNIPLVGDFDRADDNIGYNTGFGRILLDTPKTFPGDTVVYYYRFPPKGTSATNLNGWQYVYAVSAYDQGDSADQIPSLESALSYHRVIPGTLPTSDNSAEIGVYPNPYYVNAAWDGNRERLRKIYFYNLPARCQITVYTLAGDVVTVIEHDAATYSGNEINWFQQYGSRNIPAEFSGGEHAWDLISRYDQAIATGLYLFTVKDHATGTIKRGKFLVIK